MSRKDKSVTSILGFPVEQESSIGPGDSGGPAFIVVDGIPWLAGINTDGLAMDKSISLVPHRHRDWIRNMIEAFLGYNTEI